MPLGSDPAIAPAEFMNAGQPPQDSGIDEVADKIWEKYEAARSYRRMYDKDWPRFYLMYAGRQWDGRQHDWQATPVVNMVFSTINTIVPILTDSRPQISVIPRSPETDHIARVLGLIVEWLWEKNDMDVQLPKTMLNAMIFGNSFVKVFWDASAAEGQGDVRVVGIDPVHIFISPHARSLDRAEYVIHAENLPRKTVERIYASALDPKIQGAQDPKLTLERTVTSQMESRKNPLFFTSTDGAATYGYKGTGDSAGADTESDLVTVLECWERGQDGVIIQTVVVNDKTILQRPSPFEHGRFPFVQFVDMAHDWTVWGMGEVQQIEKLQLSINRRRGHILDILNYTAHPMFAYDPTAIGNADAIMPRPGLKIPIEGALQAAGWIQPPAVPTALFQVSEMDQSDVDMVLGRVDSLTGERIPGVEAGVAIDQLKESATVRMRLKSRNMEASIRRIGELKVSLIQQYYTSERIFQVAGLEAMTVEKPLTVDGFLSVNKPNGQMNPDGSPAMDNQIPPMANATFDVRVGAGSTLPVSRSALYQKVVELFGLGIVDDVEVLKNSGLPRWEEILMRSRQYWMMRQQGAMEQEMAMNEQAPQEEEPDMTDDELESEVASEATPVG